MHGARDANSPYLFPGRGEVIASISRSRGILVSGGASLPMIGALLGHTQVSTTQRYAHLQVDPLREATTRVGAVIEGQGWR